MTIVACSCKSSAQQKHEAQSNVTPATPMDGRKEVTAVPMKHQKQIALPGIAPGHCRMLGMVTAISPQPDATATGICGQTPCRAKVKILKIIGYGHSFNQTLVPNKEINAYFVFSLKPTAQLLPDLTPPLPGLKVNSTFIADVSTNTEVVGNSPPWYQVELYQVQESK
ncbi:hypothetical protein [Adhaeribacter pallidiroseus]|uniref:hypothetical protein n=1 Tax=Adhaeribacter pallidiroseus TaxID=2072847 RepID=UPI0011C0335F|nr:hypothetical protein [Adhaeribacter pallidiroseus]